MLYEYMFMGNYKYTPYKYTLTFLKLKCAITI